MTAAPLRTTVAELRDGRLAPDQLVRRAVDAVTERNGELNAVVSARLEDAVVEAGVAPDGPLRGVPFTAKDMLATRDLPTTCGSRTLAGWRSGADATAVARMRAAGAVLVGKTNCPEFALGVDTVNDLFGRTRNPLGDWTPGGSSGGESAAVAAGMSLVGLGSDYGGSVRWPAQCAGLVGLRPTVGRVSRAGEQPTLPGSDPLVPGRDTLQDLVQVVGPLARCVDDLDLVLHVIAGADGLDPLAVDAPLGDYRAIDVRHVEVRWGVEVAGATVDPMVGAAVRRAVDLLRSAGATVVDGLPDEVHEAVGLYDRIRETEPMLEIEVLDRRNPQLVGEPIAAILAARRYLDSHGRRLLFDARALLVSRLGRWLRGERVLVLPVSVDVPRDLDGGIGNFALLTPSRAISLFGVPAVSVPVTRAGSGAPVSVQVVAPAFREDVALAVASHLEQAAVPAADLGGTVAR